MEAMEVLSKSSRYGIFITVLRVLIIQDISDAYKCERGVFDLKPLSCDYIKLYKAN